MATIKERDINVSISTKTGLFVNYFKGEYLREIEISDKELEKWAKDKGYLKGNLKGQDSEGEEYDFKENLTFTQIAEYLNT